MKIGVERLAETGAIQVMERYLEDVAFADKISYNTMLLEIMEGYYRMGGEKQQRMFGEIVEMIGELFRVPEKNIKVWTHMPIIRLIKRCISILDLLSPDVISSLLTSNSLIELITGASLIKY